MTEDAKALAADFDEVRDITIIGAGPVGLSTAFWAGMREASSRIIDSLPELGGQLALEALARVLGDEVHEVAGPVRQGRWKRGCDRGRHPRTVSIEDRLDKRRSSEQTSLDRVHIRASR